MSFWDTIYIGKAPIPCPHYLQINLPKLHNSFNNTATVLLMWRKFPLVEFLLFTAVTSLSECLLIDVTPAETTTLRPVRLYIGTAVSKEPSLPSSESISLFHPSQTLVTVYQTPWHHISEEYNVDNAWKPQISPENTSTFGVTIPVMIVGRRIVNTIQSSSLPTSYTHNGDDTP